MKITLELSRKELSLLAGGIGISEFFYRDYIGISKLGLHLVMTTSGYFGSGVILFKIARLQLSDSLSRESSSLG